MKTGRITILIETTRVWHHSRACKSGREPAPGTVISNRNIPRLEVDLTPLESARGSVLSATKSTNTKIAGSRPTKQNAIIRNDISIYDGSISIGAETRES
jgi:hypothetical protein